MKLFGDHKAEKEVSEMPKEIRASASDMAAAKKNSVSSDDLVLSIEDDGRKTLMDLPEKLSIAEEPKLAAEPIDALDSSMTIQEEAQEVESHEGESEAQNPSEAAEADAPLEEASENLTEPETEPKAEPEAEPEPERHTGTMPELDLDMPVSAPSEPAAHSVTYASMAEAIQQSGKKASEAAAARSRNTIDDETLLAEIYALMGDQKKTPEVPQTAREESKLTSEKTPANQPVSPRPISQEDTVQKPQPNPAPYQPAPVVYAQDDYSVREDEPIEINRHGTSGWLKGIFLFLVSILLCGMTFYAIATDLFGKVF